jgi:hypothetical protein
MRSREKRLSRSVGKLSQVRPSDLASRDLVIVADISRWITPTMLELDSQAQPELLHVEPRRPPVDADPLADRTCLTYRKLTGGFSTAQVLRIYPAIALTHTRTDVAATSCSPNDESRHSTKVGESSRASTVSPTRGRSGARGRRRLRDPVPRCRSLVGWRSDRRRRRPRGGRGRALAVAALTLTAIAVAVVRRRRSLPNGEHK